MRKIYLLIPAILLTIVSSSQSWQWGKRGGGDNTLSDLNWTERVRQIKTDSQGNVYALCPVSKTNLDIDGNPKTGYSNGNFSDYAVVSFSCDGSYRWSKVIGGASFDYMEGLEIDAQDNIYVAGRVMPVDSSLETVHFDDDYSFPQSVSTENTYKRGMFIMKYDAAGNMLWFKLPQAEDTSIAENSQCRSLALSTDGEGNSIWFVRLNPGIYENSYTVSGTVSSFHILRYDANGNFVGGVPLSIESDGVAFNYVQMAVNHQSQTVYFGGYRSSISNYTISFEGQAMIHDMYLAAYTAQGTFLWVKQSAGTNTASDGIRSMFINGSGDLYLAGASRNGISFGTYNFTSTTGSTFPFVIKVNHDGDVIWGTNAVAGGLTQAWAVTEGAATGGYGGMTWNGINVSVPSNSGYDVYMARFDPDTGAVYAIDILEDDNGYNDYGTAITKDLHGNFYVGGRFESLLYVNSTTPLDNDGQQTDFFIAKFGSDNCTLGIKGNTKTGLNVYPNPAHDRLTVTGQSDKDYAIFNALGQRVMRGVVDGSGSIDVSRLAVGMYLLRVGNDAVLRFVKE